MGENLNSYETQEDKINDTINFLSKKIDNISPQEKETINNNIILVEKPERSTTTTTCYDIIHEGKKAGELQKLGPTAKTMLMTSKRSYGLFEQVNGGKFPDEQLITTNIQQKDQTRTVSLILPGPTYENGDLITGLAIDNGESTGQSVDITDPAVRGKGILYIQNGLLHFSHTDEMNQDEIDKLIADDRDLCTLPSIKRPGKNINSSLLEKIGGVSKNRRFLVQMQDGSSGVITLCNCTNKQAENILSDPNVSRVLYCDGVGNKGQMDGGRKEKGTSKKLVYENHTKGIGGEEVKGNMPAIFVIYNQPN